MGGFYGNKSKERSLLLAPLIAFLTTKPTILTSNAPLLDDNLSPLPSLSPASITPSLLSVSGQAYPIPQAPWTIYLCRLLDDLPFPNKRHLDVDTMWQPDFIQVSGSPQAAVAIVNLLSFSGASSPVEQTMLVEQPVNHHPLLLGCTRKPRVSASLCMRQSTSKFYSWSGSCSSIPLGLDQSCLRVQHALFPLSAKGCSSWADQSHH